MAEQSRMGQHLGTFRSEIAKSIPLSNGAAALLMTGLQEVFNEITDCPCNSGVTFGVSTLLGPIIILLVSLLTPVCELYSAPCGHNKKARLKLLRYCVFTLSASVSWLSVALLNSEAVCCIQGGFPSDSPCLAGKSTTANVVRYEECISDSRIYGAWMMMVGGALSSIVVVIVHVKYIHIWSVEDPDVPNQSEGP